MDIIDMVPVAVGEGKDATNIEAITMEVLESMAFLVCPLSFTGEGEAGVDQEGLGGGAVDPWVDIMAGTWTAFHSFSKTTLTST